MTKEEIRKEIRDCNACFEKGREKELRDMLAKIALEYKPKGDVYSYYDFIDEQKGCFEINTNKLSYNYPHLYCLFTISSQHIYGDSLEECLDEAMGM